MSELTPENYDQETFELPNPMETVEKEFQTQSEEEVSTPVDQPKSEKVEDKSVAHFQRIAQEKHDLAMQKENLLREKDAEIQAINAKLADFEKRLQPQKENELLPPKPADPSDPMDRLRYAEELAEYNNKVYFKEINELKAEREQRKQLEEMQELRRGQLSQFMSVGMSAEKAGKVYNFAISPESTNPTNLEAYYDWYTNKAKSPTATTNKFENSPLPAGVSAGETENQTIDPHVRFNQEMEKNSPRSKWL